MHKMFMLTAALLILSGCSTQYYQDRAVRRARAYLLDSEELQLDRAQVEYVKFNKPVILMAEILRAYPYGHYQFCVTWQIPGLKEAAMVFGTSDQRMIDWSPNRLILRDFAPWDRNRQALINAARNYAVNNMFHSFSVEQYNHVRFTDPEILPTDFDLISELPGEFDAEEMARSLAGQRQFSAVWDLPGSAGQCAVLCGTGAADLGRWSLNFGAIMDRSELDGRISGEAPAVSLDAVDFVELSDGRMVRAPQQPVKE